MKWKQLASVNSINRHTTTIKIIALLDSYLWLVCTFLIPWIDMREKWYEMMCSDWLGAVHKWHCPLRGEGGSAKKRHYSISLFSIMGDKGEGGVKNFKKSVTSFMDSPLVRAAEKQHIIRIPICKYLSRYLHMYLELEICR